MIRGAFCINTQRSGRLINLASINRRKDLTFPIRRMIGPPNRTVAMSKRRHSEDIKRSVRERFFLRSRTQSALHNCANAQRARLRECVDECDINIVACRNCR